jgi:hypothetical protein
MEEFDNAVAVLNEIVKVVEWVAVKVHGSMSPRFLVFVVPNMSLTNKCRPCEEHPWK